MTLTAYFPMIKKITMKLSQINLIRIKFAMILIVHKFPIRMKSLNTLIIKPDLISKENMIHLMR